MIKRKAVGSGMVPHIHQKQAQLFEDAFVVLCDFGEQTFAHYVSQKNPREQQEIFDVFRLFKMRILHALNEVKS
jgi:hypothetical protein